MIHTEAKAKIAMIGGTGLADPTLFRVVEELDVDTPYGKTSDKITIADFNGIRVAFLPRHGSGHTIPPALHEYPQHHP